MRTSPGFDCVSVAAASIARCLARIIHETPADGMIHAQATRAMELLHYVRAELGSIPVISRDHGAAYGEALAALGSSADSNLLQQRQDVRFEDYVAVAGSLLENTKEREATEALRSTILTVEAGYSAARVATGATTDVEMPTSPDSAHHRPFDREALLRFINETMATAAPVTAVEGQFLSGGNSKYTLALQLDRGGSDRQRIILRGDPPDFARYGGTSVAREFALLEALHAHGANVPKPIALEATGTVFGAPFYLMEARPGATIGHMFNLPSPSPALNRSIAQNLADIHKFRVGGTRLHLDGAEALPSSLLESLIRSLQAAWSEVGGASNIMGLGFDWLLENVKIMDQNVGLVHGDFGLQNILVKDEAVSCILDWEFAHVGNPAYDLGYFYYQAESLDGWDAFHYAYLEAGGLNFSATEIEFSIILAIVRLAVQVAQAEVVYAAGKAGETMDDLVIRRFRDVSMVRLADRLRRQLR